MVNIGNVVPELPQETQPARSTSTSRATLRHRWNDEEQRFRIQLQWILTYRVTMLIYV